MRQLRGIRSMCDLKGDKGSIVYFGGFEMPDRNAAAHRVLNNGKALKMIGYDVVFSGVDSQIDSDRKEPEFIGGFGSLPQRCPKGFFQEIKALVSSKHIRLVIEKTENVRFVIAYNTHMIPLWNLLRYCRKKNIFLIADVTEWYENRFSLSPVKFIRWIDTELVMKILHKRTDGIISISNYLTNYYRKFGKKIVQIPPLIDKEDNHWKNTPKSFSNQVEFVYSGSIGRGDKDRIDLLVDVFSMIELDYLFTVVGITKKQFIEKYPGYDAKITALGSKIRFCGRVSHEESILSIKRADYCIFVRNPSRKNNAGFPTKFVECMTTGVGVIANDVSNISDYFPFENGYLLDAIDLVSIKIIIELCISKGKVEHRETSIFDYKEYIGSFQLFFDGYFKK